MVAPKVFWVRPVCDQLLLTIQQWAAVWEQGEWATRREAWDVERGSYHIVTKRSVEVLWNLNQLRELVRIAEALRPEWEYTKDFRNLLNAFATIKQKKIVPAHQRRVKMISYKEDVEDLLALLEQAKTLKPEQPPANDAGDFWGNVNNS